MFFKILKMFSFKEITIGILVLGSLVSIFSLINSGIEGIKESAIKDVTISDLSTANKEAVKTIDNKTKSLEIDVAVVADKFKAHIKIETSFNKLKAKKLEKLRHINDKYIKADEILVREREVSKAQIGFLWDLYCSEIPNHSNCGVN